MTTAIRGRSPGRPRQGAGWDATNKPVTFYCPVDLLNAVEERMKRFGQSKTQVIVDGVRAETFQIWWNPRSVGYSTHFRASYNPYNCTTPAGRTEWSVYRVDGQEALVRGTADSVIGAREMCRVVMAELETIELGTRAIAAT